MGILERLASEGGYVFAVYRGIRGAKIGFVKPEAGITLYRGRWRTRPEREAVLKVVKMERSITLSASESLSLSTVQPRMGTICQWHKAGTRVASMLEVVFEQVLGSLTPDLQEVMCLEYLREPAASDHGLPRLKYTLAPVGRTMRDVDIFGMTADDRIIAAQVTYLTLKRARHKLKKLDAYADSKAHTVLFCNCDVPQQVGKHHVFPLSLVFEEFCLQNEHGRRWFKRIATY